MRKSRFTEAQILSILGEGEAGLPVTEVCRKHGISTAAYYQWKSKYAGMSVSELKRTKELESENARLKRMYAELALENGEAVDAESEARGALERAAGCGQDALVLRAESLVARALETQGRLNDAIEAWEAVLPRLSGPDLIAAGIALSRCYREAGDLALAIEVGVRIETTIAESGLEGTDDAVRLAMTVAAAYFERGDLNQASRRCRRAIDKAEALQSASARSAASWEASIVQARRGDLTAASRLAGQALALLGEGDDRRNLARLRVQMSRFLLRSEQPDVGEALRETERARTEMTSTSSRGRPSSRS